MSELVRRLLAKLVGTEADRERRRLRDEGEDRAGGIRRTDLTGWGSETMMMASAPRWTSPSGLRRGFVLSGGPHDAR